MASYGSRGGNLDATSPREVVYCYQCAHEWYRDDSTSLQCPRCSSDATEIVDPADDPRRLGEPRSSRDLGSRDPGDPGDPEEGDIDDHNGDPFFTNRYRPASESPFVEHHRIIRESAGTQADGGDIILRRFADMLMNDFGGARPPRGGPESMFPQAGEQATRDDFNHFGIFPPPGRRAAGAPATFQRTTFRSGSSPGSATFTIVSSSIPRGGGGTGAQTAFPAFPALFTQIMNNASPLNPDDPDRPGGAGPRQQQMPGGMGFATGLHEILATLLNPQAAVHGDAVYTQEALDRIITTLMEANPQSNAAPPASQEAISRLEKKLVDDKMLGPEGKAECTICIDELHRGDEVTVLPCAHWFHGECVTLWLKEHNTCPICRAPMEQRNGQGNNPQQAQQSQQPQAPGQTAPSAIPTSIFGQRGTRTDRFTRSPRENEERLGAIRNLSGYRVPGSFPEQSRRSSLSPPSPQTRTESPARTMWRTPSLGQDQDSGVSPYDRHGEYLGNNRYSTGYGTGSGRDGRDSRNGRDRESIGRQSSQTSQGGQGQGAQSTQSPHSTHTTSHNPLSWLRDHLGGRGSSSSDRDRDRRR